ncbi:MAG: hypothetical protein ACREUA_03855 [Burkholderiales bacterium]
MKKFAIAVFLSGFFWASSGYAERVLPRDAKPGELKGYNYPLVRINNKDYTLGAATRIYDQGNRLILYNVLPSRGKVYFLADAQGNLSRIWLLDKTEVASKPRQF